MPVSVRKIRDRRRITERGGNIARTEGGKPRDGGGHDSEEKAKAQARAINVEKEK